MMQTNSLKVMTWNACSFRGKHEELLVHATNHNVDIKCYPKSSSHHLKTVI